MPEEFRPWGEPVQVRKPFLERMRWGLIGLVAAAIVAFLLLTHPWKERPSAVSIDESYQRDVNIVTSEYRKFHGRLLRDPELEQRFRMASEYVDKKNYAAAIELLEGVSQEAALPIIFNNLGALYVAVGDRGRAVAAYREALARDGGYKPVRDSIDRLRSLALDEAAPLLKEIEPNGSDATANLIGLDGPVEAEIEAGDVDVFRFVTPPVPRDILQIEIKNLDPQFAAEIHVYDKELKHESPRVPSEPGGTLVRYVSQPPNTTLYLQVWGLHNATGKYRATVRALKRFDLFEPNDDIFSAAKIEVGQKIEANIMDGDDTDYYSFESPRSGTVEIEIRNESPLLIPALTTFGSDRRNSGFGPDVRTAGASLKHRLEVQEHLRYYVQVWSQAQSSGKYSLTIY